MNEQKLLVRENPRRKGGLDWTGKCRVTATIHCQKLCSPNQSDEKLYNRTMSTKMQRTLRTAARLLSRATWTLLVIFILIPLESGKTVQQLGPRVSILDSKDFQRDSQIQIPAMMLGFPPRLTGTFVLVRKPIKDPL